MQKADVQLWPLALFHLDGRPNWNIWNRYLAGLQIFAPDRKSELFPENIVNGKRVRRAPEHICAIFNFLVDLLNPLSHDYIGKWEIYTYQSAVLAMGELMH
ncbi:MAG: hypothetical protein IPK08_19645 [Bacteroidetes bacterium]|nr:hypothetical protein [Bacteroidota bacterium]